MSLEYTLAVTSCGRWDLLEITLESYFRCCGIMPIQTIVLEDGPLPPLVRFDDLPIRWEVNGQRLGQIRSCDRLMEMVQTENVVWLEDDWRFKEENWLEPSFAILEAFPEISFVSLRGRAWNHPLVARHPYPFLIAEPGWNDGWGGLCFNPGLRRKSDYVKMGPYAQGGLNMWACQSEQELSRRYLKAGYRIADLGRPIIEHLGHGRSKTKEPIP
jgi:hypothetical protein